jgi:hypothetical protein
LAGIASKLETRLADTYLYGLWKDDLHWGILFVEGWHRNFQYTVIPEPTWHDEPSWSWAALHGSVVWDDSWNPRGPNSVPACQIEVVTTSTLQLTGMLIPLSSKEFHEIYVYISNYMERIQSGTQSNGITIYVMADQWFLRKFDNRWADAENSNDDSGSDSVVVDAFRAAVVAMPVLFIETLKDDGTVDCSSVICLLLYAHPGLDKGVYRRVGVAKIEIDDESDGSMGTLRATLQTYQEPLLDPWYHKIDGDGEYTISVV